MPRKSKTMLRKFKGRYLIKWLDNQVHEVYIADKQGDIPCFERFVYVYDVKTHDYLGLCGAYWFRDNIILDQQETWLHTE